MEWKKVKSILILIFIGINIFLGYMVYEKNNLSQEMKSLSTVKEILSNRAVVLNTDIGNYPVQLRRIAVENNEKINLNDMSIVYPANSPQVKALKTMKENTLKSTENKLNVVGYTGNKKEIIAADKIIMNLIRDTKIENNQINKFELVYKVINNIDAEVVSAEMEPIWHIVLADGTEYNFNAYSGVMI